jgi:hypothetical protein
VIESSRDSHQTQEGIGIRCIEDIAFEVRILLLPFLDESRIGLDVCDYGEESFGGEVGDLGSGVDTPPRYWRGLLISLISDTRTGLTIKVYDGRVGRGLMMVNVGKGY